MNCAKCFYPFDNTRSVRPEETLEDGAFLLCGACGNVNVVHVNEEGNTSTRMITKQEYNAMHPQDKNDLYFAIRTIIAQHHKNKRKIVVPFWYNPENKEQP